MAFFRKNLFEIKVKKNGVFWKKFFYDKKSVKYWRFLEKIFLIKIKKKWRFLEKFF